MSVKLSRKPDDVLRRVGAGGTRATVDRIMKVWSARTDSDVERGVRWYGEDAEIHLSTLVRLGATSREHAAAIVSHLSRRTTWSRNLAGAYALVTDGADGARGVGCMEANVTGAISAHLSADPLGTLNGPKTKRFAWNLLGIRTAVTVDVWAARIAFGDSVEDPETILSRVGVYEAVEHAYRLAARRAGVDPTTMQATTWIVARGGRAD